ncbi:hypothetical protein SLS62_010793 [Diatrype stigma]|uniref:Thioredoxin domain-containing protein n=1 Tax=Diatrype stigma TaxID=117547 RepID=A0AAN9U7N4_9PEZI
MRPTIRITLPTALKGLRAAGSGASFSFRSFSATRHQLRGPNQIYDPVRRPDDLHTYILLSSSARRPLITLWTASWCATCRTVAPLVRSVIESGAGEAEGGVAYCEVEYDAPDIMSGGLGGTYMITSMPTLLSFDAGEAQVATKVAAARKLTDRAFLEEWVREEARRQGGRGGGGGGGGGAGLAGFFKGWL